ncbi:IS1/IS6 family transposase [Candidatus Woesearchaeota archaeon]|nr:IS1/IS6 family transposase [Candidatus Woesearchaeota archaeon]
MIPMHCPQCNKISIKNGRYKDFQKFKCKNCSLQFSERSLSFFHRHRYPEEIIRNSILFCMFVSTRISKFMLQETLQFKPSHVSIYRWTLKFANHLANLKRSRSFSNIWHVDEKFIRVRGSKDDFAYLWVVIDDKNNMITAHVSLKRDINGAVAALTKANKIAEKPPDILISDGLQAYKKACKKVFGRKTKHFQAHFKTVVKMIGNRLYFLSNNRIESLNSKINLWYKRFRGFKRLATANLWCEMWMHFYNLIRPRVIPHKTISIHAII